MGFGGEGGPHILLGVGDGLAEEGVDLVGVARLGEHGGDVARVLEFAERGHGPARGVALGKKQNAPVEAEDHKGELGADGVSAEHLENARRGASSRGELGAEPALRAGDAAHPPGEGEDEGDDQDQGADGLGDVTKARGGTLVGGLAGGFGVRGRGRGGEVREDVADVAGAERDGGLVGQGLGSISGLDGSIAGLIGTDVGHGAGPLGVRGRGRLGRARIRGKRANLRAGVPAQEGDRGEQESERAGAEHGAILAGEGRTPTPGGGVVRRRRWPRGPLRRYRRESRRHGCRSCR